MVQREVLSLQRSIQGSAFDTEYAIKYVELSVCTSVECLPDIPAAHHVQYLIIPHADRHAGDILFTVCLFFVCLSFCPQHFGNGYLGHGWT